MEDQTDPPHDPAFERVPAVAASRRIEKVAMEKDSENALLWKFSHRRLEAEELRDADAGGVRDG